jgi:hypothetical protein
VKSLADGLAKLTGLTNLDLNLQGQLLFLALSNTIF